jgi:hypothetical protein
MFRDKKLHSNNSNNMKKSIFYFALITLMSCGLQDNRPSKSVDNLTDNEDFDFFIEKFYSDSIFQFSHIIFPLKGEEIDGGNYTPDDIADTNETEKKVWVKDDFQRMIPSIKDYPDKYNREITKTNDTVTEKIYIPNSGYYEIRTFIRKENKWFLDYFLIHSL